MKKLVVFTLLVIVPFLAFAGGSKESASKEPKKGDFSANVNYDRATPAAKTLKLPVSGIGTQISTEVKAAKKYKICVITKNSTNPYMIGMWNGAKKAAADMNFEVTTLAPATQDSIEEQIAIMESMIEEGVDAFVIHPSDSNGIMAGVNAANEAGVPAIAIGTAPTSGAFLRSGVDYYETGYLITKDLCQQVGGKGGIIILEGPPGAQNAIERLEGCKAALKEFPDMKILASQTANFKRAEALQVMENLLQRDDVKKNLNIVVGSNDEMAIGAIQALKSAKMTGVLIGGFDGSKDASAAIKDGDLSITYNTDPFGSTYLACVYLVEFLNEGKVPPEYFIPFPSEAHKPLITPVNINDYIANVKWWN